jgi:hypothetical protein
MFFAQKWEQKMAIYQSGEVAGKRKRNKLLCCRVSFASGAVYLVLKWHQCVICSTSFDFVLPYRPHSWSIQSLSSCIRRVFRQAKWNTSLETKMSFTQLTINHWLSPSSNKFVFLSSFASNLLHKRQKRNSFEIHLFLLLFFFGNFQLC